MAIVGFSESRLDEGVDMGEITASTADLAGVKVLMSNVVRVALDAAGLGLIALNPRSRLSGSGSQAWVPFQWLAKVIYYLVVRVRRAGGEEVDTRS